MNANFALHNAYKFSILSSFFKCPASKIEVDWKQAQSRPLWYLTWIAFLKQM